MEDLNAETAVSAGGWDERYAVTLAVDSRGGIDAALIDTNGDEADIDLDQYECGADKHWHETVSGSAGDRGYVLVTRHCSHLGMRRARRPGRLEYLGHRHSMVASASGWWLFIGPATEDSEALPRAIDGSS